EVGVRLHEARAVGAVRVDGAHGREVAGGRDGEEGGGEHRPDARAEPCVAEEEAPTEHEAAADAPRLVVPERDVLAFAPLDVTGPAIPLDRGEVLVAGTARRRGDQDGGGSRGDDGRPHIAPTRPIPMPRLPSRSGTG